MCDSFIGKPAIKKEFESSKVFVGHTLKHAFLYDNVAKYKKFNNVILWKCNLEVNYG